MNGAQRYTFSQLRDQVDEELQKPDMPKRFYKSTDGIFRIIDAIIKTKGEGWAAQVLNNQGQSMLTEVEQKQFTEAFQPYLQSILAFFGKEDDLEVQGGAIPTPSALSGLSPEFLDTKMKQVTGELGQKIDPTKMFGIDDVYAKMINKVNQVDTTVNDYASKYGLLRLEKEHDLLPDIRLIPQPLRALIAEGITALGTAAGVPVPPQVTLDILDKIKVSMRLIIFTVYLALDVTRVAMAISNQTMGRKILSIVLSILEFLRGDWKKAILSFIGYYGTTPLLFGEIIKVYLTLFRSLSPQLQEDIVFGTLDTTKSLLVGLLLALFQVAAPEEVRLPLIGILEKIAQKKAQLDGELIDAGLSARPAYLSPTFEDLNNIQALISDKAFICSSEFEDLLKQVDSSPLLKIILQILRIPVTEEFRKFKCGTEPSKPMAEGIVTESIANQNAQKALAEPVTTQLPVETSPTNILTRPVKGGRILHSRRKTPTA